MDRELSGMPNFCLHPTEMQKLDDLHQKLTKRAGTFIGYQVNHTFDYSELYRFLKFSINNVGDPFVESNYGVNTKEFELEVLDFFAKLMNMDADDYWGYVTNGGTAGNLFGIYAARELYPEAVFYYSKEAHYSIPKAARMLKLPYEIIDSHADGRMDLTDLEKKLDAKKPAIICATVGTTMRGAVDDVEQIVHLLKKMEITNSHIHVDAALGGLLLPFLANSPMFDFQLPIGSMAISGHKMIGSPIPCGIALVRKAICEKIQKPIEYIGSVDNTIAGSRNGLSPLFLWYAIKKFGKKGLESQAKSSRRHAEYALSKFKEIGWNAFLNPYANVVVFDRPSDVLVKKWQLAVQGEISHIYAMGHVSEKLIDEFIAELENSRLQNIASKPL